MHIFVLNYVPNFCQNRQGPPSIVGQCMATSNMKLIGAFLIKLWSAQAFSSYFYKMSLIHALVSQLRETQALACGGCGRDGGQTKTIISPIPEI